MFFRSAYWNANPDSIARILLIGDPQMEGSARIEREGLYGQISVWLNDAHFANVVSNNIHFLFPSHIVVLGDIFSKQNLPRHEFNYRLNRYNKIFNHPEIVSKQIHLINISGNHDIGYGNEVSAFHVAQFEEGFGPVNNQFEFADHLFAILNSQVLDGARHQDVHDAVWLHVEHLAMEKESRNLPLILLMHIPLYKPKGICVDDPEIRTNRDGYTIEQTMLSEQSSEKILQKLTPTFVFTGHDHYGCSHQHHNTQEYTIQSVMGDFCGFSAMFEISRSEDNTFEYKMYFSHFVSIYTITAVIVCWFVWIGLLVLYFIFFCGHKLAMQSKKRL